eukprot:NODE_35_length_31537_cov_0.293403.p8 type:complete len:374 gc:universal NODE_35_length_31537_cov_0.293403:16700-17821(+)
MLSKSISAQADYFKQYSNLYFCRLNQAKMNLKELDTLEKVSDIVRHNSEEVCVLGTVFQDKKIHDYSKVDELEYLDVYYLEDEYSRILLDRNSHTLISGTVIGVRGTVKNDTLVVKEIVYPYDPKNGIAKKVEFEKPWILLVSGMEIQSSEDSIKLSALYHLLSGHDIQFPVEILQELETIAIVGNSFHDLTQESIGNMNDFVGEISQYHNVLLVPSNNDPTTVSWPNKPMPPHLFPKATKSVTSVENPARFDSNGLEIIFSSGDAVNKIHSILNIKSQNVSKDEIKRLLIQCRHLAPCCPDTLPCIPSFEEDPLYLTNIPDVLFIGNQAKEGILQVGSCTVVSIPSFKSTGKVVLYNFVERRLQVIEFNKQF